MSVPGARWRRHVINPEIRDQEKVKVSGDPAWTKDPETLALLDFIKPGLDPNDNLTVYDYYNAAMVVALLRQCGDNLTVRLAI